MKILTPCMKCFQENGVTNLSIELQNIKDDGMYKIKCNRGHIDYQILSNEKFEVLFDMGLDALNNGYRQEAVACFTTSLERFHEWFIKLILFKKGIDIKKFNKTWKLVSNQSERQLGAFYFLYLNEFLENPKGVENSRKFRNDVIHKGYIPENSEVCDYGEDILNYIQNVINKMDNKYDNYILDLALSRQAELREKYKIETGTVSGSINTVIDIMGNNKIMTFEQALENIKERENMFKSGFENLNGIKL